MSSLPPIREWWKWIGAFLIGCLRAIPDLIRQRSGRRK